MAEERIARGDDQANEWWCGACATWNFNDKKHCRWCRTPKPTPATPTQGDDE